ncbi:kinase-like protein [Xylaria sp. FL0933]|nr:kinase-like protein [Xylaria sp. FL0933]
MYDHRVFAVLTAKDVRNRASSAFKLAHNAKWFQPAVGGVAERATIGSREPTPAIDAEAEEAEGSGGAVDRLVLTFSELMRLENFEEGVQLGTNPATCHILLGHRGTRGISARHYSIVVDRNMWIWLHDRYSTHGTIVAHNKQNENERRRNETWLLAYGPATGMSQSFKNITITSGSLVIGIEFPNHNCRDARYLENLRALVKKANEHDGVNITGLGLHSQATTKPPSEVQTVGDRLIYVKDGKIGSGAYGQVFKTIRARDGKVLAAKIIKPPVINSQKRRRGHVEPSWLAEVRREYTIMEDNRHPNIVQVFEMREEPEVMIVMRYFPSGNIVQAAIHDESRLITAFGQLLDCLSFLHSRRITHRDIKPENVLVELVPNFKVVLSDFGFSKEATETAGLQTFCGTLKYLAPEVFPFSATNYGPPADVWSLGVVALEWLYDIPETPKEPECEPARGSVRADDWLGWAQSWLSKLASQLHDQEEGIDVDLLQGMLVVNQQRRMTAARCLEMGMINGLFKRRAVDGLVACLLDGEEETITSS